MEDFLARIAANLIGRLHGPLTLRLYLQPAVAVFFAIRAGLRDAREDRPPSFSRRLLDPQHRREGLRQGWKDVGKVFVIAVILDIIYQLRVIQWIYPGEALIVAGILALAPYVLLRALVARIARLGRPVQGPR